MGVVKYLVGPRVRVYLSVCLFVCLFVFLFVCSGKRIETSRVEIIVYKA